MVSRKNRKARSKRSRYSAGEYFVAAIGLALLVFVLALVLTADSCKVQLSPDIGVQPARPQPTPTSHPNP